MVSTFETPCIRCDRYRESYWELGTKFCTSRSRLGFYKYYTSHCSQVQQQTLCQASPLAACGRPRG